MIPETSAPPPACAPRAGRPVAAPPPRAKNPGSRRAFGSIERRAGLPGFYVWFRVAGRRFHRYAGATRALASAKLASVHALVDHGHDAATILHECFGDLAGARITLRQAGPLFLEWGATRWKPSVRDRNAFRLRVLCAAPFAGAYLPAVRAEEVARWAQGRVGAGAAPSTANRDLSLLSRLYKWAKTQGYVEANPVAGVERFSEKGRGREVYLTPDEARALLGAASPVLRPMLLAALHLGCRLGELRSLRWRDVDLDRGEVAIRREVEKTSRGRVLAVTDALRAALEEAKASRKIMDLAGDDPVFVSTRGRAWSRNGPWTALRAALDRCGTIPAEKRAAFSFHGARHTFVSLMAGAGVDLPTILLSAGHTTLAASARYRHFWPEAQRAAARKLGALMAGGGADGSAAPASSEAQTEAG